MVAENQTVEQIAREQAQATILRLASKTVECSVCHGFCIMKLCTKCQGSGTIPKFKGLTEQCGCQLIEKSHLKPDRKAHAIIIQHERYGDCRPYGWLPGSIEKAWAVLVQIEEFQNWLLRERSEYGRLTIWEIVRTMGNPILAIAAAGNCWPEDG